MPCCPSSSLKSEAFLTRDILDMEVIERLAALEKSEDAAVLKQLSILVLLPYLTQATLLEYLKKGDYPVLNDTLVQVQLMSTGLTSL
jgi:hypothetical protein